MTSFSWSSSSSCWLWLVALGMIAGSVNSVDAASDETPDACAGVQSSGFVADVNDTNSYYWCHKATGKGVKVTCTPEGYEWNKDQQTCVPAAYNEATKTCLTILPEVGNGTWSCPTDATQPVGSLCSFTCDEGYRLMSGNMELGYRNLQNLGVSAEVMCNLRIGKNSDWSLDVTQFACFSFCDPNPCGFGNCALVSGKANCTCDPGWKRQEENMQESPCLTTENNCPDINCGNNGFCINGHPSASCVCNKGFEGELCQTEITCENPTNLNLTNGTSETNGVSSFTYGVQVNITCEDGFWFSGSESPNGSLSCGARGKFEDARGNEFESGGDAICQIVDCRRPKVGSASGSTTFGSEGTLSCDSGYNEEGSGYRCQADGTWGPARCVPHDCGKLTSLDRATVTGDEFSFGSELNVTCESGYVINGTDDTSAIVTCQTSGWTDFKGCVAQSCPKDFVGVLSDEKDANVIIAWVNPNSKPAQDPEISDNAKVQLSCPSNYMLVGGDAKGQLSCGYGGWEPAMPKPTCKNLKCDATTFTNSFANGTATVDDTDGAPGTTLKMDCNDGFVINSVPTANEMNFTCEKNAAENRVFWNSTTTDDWMVTLHPTPECVRLTCPPLTNPADGEYASLEEGSFGDAVALNCDGDLVSSPPDIDQVICGRNSQWETKNGINAKNVSCVEASCPSFTLDGGTVFLNGKKANSYPIGGNFTFECDFGYTLNPTNHTITCENGSSSVGEYSGSYPNCQNEDNCRTPDGNDVDCGQGTCEDGLGFYNCSCNPGWSGDKCNVETNPCDSNPCMNNADCETNTDYTEESNQFEYKCECKPNSRYSGYQCQKDNTVAKSNADCIISDGKNAHPGSCRKYVDCLWGEAKSEVECSNTDEVFDPEKANCEPVISASRESNCTMNYSLT